MLCGTSIGALDRKHMFINSPVLYESLLQQVTLVGAELLFQN